MWKGLRKITLNNCMIATCHTNKGYDVRSHHRPATTYEETFLFITLLFGSQVGLTQAHIIKIILLLWGNGGCAAVVSRIGLHFHIIYPLKKMKKMINKSWLQPLNMGHDQFYKTTSCGQSLTGTINKAPMSPPPNCFMA